MSKTSTVVIETEPNSARVLTTTYTEVLSVNKSDPMFWTVEYLDRDGNVVRSSYNKQFIFRFTQFDNEQKTSND